MWALVWLLQGLFAPSAVGYVNTPCMRSLLKCSPFRLSLLDGKFSDRFIEDHVILRRQCRSMDAFLECMEEAALMHCKNMSPEEEKFIKTRLYVADVCNDVNDSRKAYFKGAACINRQMNRVQEACVPDYYVELVNTPSLVSLEGSCVLQTLLANCRKDAIQKMCGAEAGDLYGRVKAVDMDLDFLCLERRDLQNPEFLLDVSVNSYISLLLEIMKPVLRMERKPLQDTEETQEDEFESLQSKGEGKGCFGRDGCSSKQRTVVRAPHVQNLPNDIWRRHGFLPDSLVEALLREKELADQNSAPSTSSSEFSSVKTPLFDCDTFLERVTLDNFPNLEAERNKILDEEQLKAFEECIEKLIDREKQKVELLLKKALNSFASLFASKDVERKPKSFIDNIQEYDFTKIKVEVLPTVIESGREKFPKKASTSTPAIPTALIDDLDSCETKPSNILTTNAEETSDIKSRFDEESSEFTCPSIESNQIPRVSNFGASERDPDNSLKYRMNSIEDTRHVSEESIKHEKKKNTSKVVKKYIRRSGEIEDEPEKVRHQDIDLETILALKFYGEMLTELSSVLSSDNAESKKLLERASHLMDVYRNYMKGNEETNSFDTPLEVPESKVFQKRSMDAGDSSTSDESRLSKDSTREKVACFDVKYTPEDLRIRIKMNVPEGKYVKYLVVGAHRVPLAIHVDVQNEIYVYDTEVAIPERTLELDVQESPKTECETMENFEEVFAEGESYLEMEDL